MFVLAITGGIFVVVGGLIFYAAVRFGSGRMTMAASHRKFSAATRSSFPGPSFRADRGGAVFGDGALIFRHPGCARNDGPGKLDLVAAENLRWLAAIVIRPLRKRTAGIKDQPSDHDEMPPVIARTNMERLKMDCDGVAAGEKMLVFVFSANACCAPDTAKIAAALSMRRGQKCRSIALHTHLIGPYLQHSAILLMASSDLTDASQRSATHAHNRARWNIAFLLGFGVLINFFDRVNLSVAHDALRSTFSHR